jgi:NADH:ubiquinone oxidoreductase subunit 5 (subunit L)/multisubunit Na+/H+ antiporter MnhA subunit
VSGRWIVLLPLGLPLACVALQLLLARVLSARAKGWLALAGGLGALVGVICAWPSVLAGKPVDQSFGHWDGPIQLAYHVDGLSFLFALMAAGIGSAVLLYAVAYMERDAGATRFYCFVLIFVAGLVHLVYSADLFLVYFSWEVVGLCSFFLVGFWYKLPEAAYGARKVLTITHLAGYGLFVAVLLLYLRTGTTLWTDPRVSSAFTGGIFALMFVAAVAKSVQFPLHTWIPDAMAAPTPVSALLHAACYVKAGVYLVARMHSFAPWPVSWRLTVAWVGAATVLIGALFALAQRDLKRLLAFSTVSQIGYMMVGLGIGTPLAIAAGLMHCLNHGLFKAGLFLCAGAVQHACGTRDMDQLGGLSRKMPRTMRIWLLCAGGIAGVPLLNGFVSKWLLYSAAVDANQPVLALIPWIGSILTVFYFLKATSGVFLGSDGPATEHAHESAWPMLAGGGVLGAGCVLLGVAPQLAMTYVINPLLPTLGVPAVAGVSWFGMTTGQGMWFASVGLVLSFVALLIGAVIYWFPSTVRGAVTAGGPPTVFTGGEPLSVEGHLGAADFAQMSKQHFAAFYRAFDADRYWLNLWHLVCDAAQTLQKLVFGLERRAALALCVIAGLSALATMMLPSAPAAVAAAVPGSLVPLIAGMLIALIALVAAAAATNVTRRTILPLIVAGACALGGALAHESHWRMFLLELAAVLALLVVWKMTAQRRARYAYLTAVLISAAGMVGGAIAAEHGQPHLAMALILPGVAAKLALVPLWFWLPLVAETTPAIAVGLVVSVVDVAAFGEVLTLRVSDPSLFAPAAPWLVLGIASAIGGALLALAQRDLKRLLAFSTVEDMGMLIVVLCVGGQYGWEAAAIGATVHALAKALLFVAVSAPEAAKASLVDARGLASRHPVAAAGFAVGALSILGVPPTLGYAAHWRVFTAVAGSPSSLTIFAGAAMLCVAMYARAIALFWWGEPQDESVAAGATYNRTLLSSAVVLLIVVLLLAGIWPRLLGGAA